MKAVILAASKSEKIFPFSETRHKSMIFCSGGYILEIIIKQLKELGIKEIYIIVNHKKNIIQSYFEYGKSLRVNIRYIVQEKAGIGKAILQAENYVAPDSHFFLVYGDILTVKNHMQAFKKYIKNPPSYCIAAVTHTPMQKVFMEIPI